MGGYLLYSQCPCIVCVIMELGWVGGVGMGYAYAVGVAYLYWHTGMCTGMYLYVLSTVSMHCMYILYTK